MFTGIVDHCGVVRTRENGAQGIRLFIECGFAELVPGESIAVNGCCLTVVEPKSGGFHCDLSSETLALTKASEYVSGTRVNLERAMRLGDRLGGHLVTGHIDGRGRVERINPEGEYTRFEFSGVSPEHKVYLMKKGSVCVDGVSLTINEVDESSADGRFQVMVIPHTAERTNLKDLEVGSPVNLELDWMMKVILKQAGQRRDVLGLSSQEIAR